MGASLVWIRDAEEGAIIALDSAHAEGVFTMTPSASSAYRAELQQEGRVKYTPLPEEGVTKIGDAAAAFAAWEAAWARLPEGQEAVEGTQFYEDADGVVRVITWLHTCPHTGKSWLCQTRDWETTSL
jgi:hypothetical protein